MDSKKNLFIYMKALCELCMKFSRSKISRKSEKTSIECMQASHHSAPVSKSNQSPNRKISIFSLRNGESFEIFPELKSFIMRRPRASCWGLLKWNFETGTEWCDAWIGACFFRIFSKFYVEKITRPVTSYRLLSYKNNFFLRVHVTWKIYWCIEWGEREQSCQKRKGL